MFSSYSTQTHTKIFIIKKVGFWPMKEENTTFYWVWDEAHCKPPDSPEKILEQKCVSSLTKLERFPNSKNSKSSSLLSAIFFCFLSFFNLFFRSLSDSFFFFFRKSSAWLWLRLETCRCIINQQGQINTVFIHKCRYMLKYNYIIVSQIQIKDDIWCKLQNFFHIY